MTFWDAKKAYFVEKKMEDMSPQEAANCKLLEAMLNQAYQAGYDDAKRDLTKPGTQRKIETV